jgi:hypothetical protein
MPSIISDRGTLGDLRGDLARLEALTDDLRRFAQGDLSAPMPSAEVPILNNYALGERKTLCLTGDCSDHPLIRPTFITTSDVWVLAPELGWARTFSRFYRLGRLATPMKIS